MTHRYSLQHAFHTLDQLLTRNQHYWQFRPFYHRQLPWPDSEKPAQSLNQALEQLSDDRLKNLQENPEQLAQWLSQWIPEALQLSQLSTELLSRADSRNSLPDQPQVDQSELKRFAQGIPGRKWRQMLDFSRQLHPAGASSTTRFLEWCAGKGHLGRLLAYQTQQQQTPYQVTSLEWQQILCEKGEQEAAKWQLNQCFINADALSDEAAQFITPETRTVALHACGDLHCQLIHHARQKQAHSLYIAPCCYHLIRAEHYQPMSQTGKQSTLTLSKQDLKIPLQETVTGGQRIGQLRDTELLWRMAFDTLLKDQLQQSDYQPLPTIPKYLLTGAFEDFVHWAVHNRDLQHAVDNSISAQHIRSYLQQGQQRVHMIRRMELVQHLFRRPLELWLVLDRALALEEVGFHVELTEFCDKKLTPRNIMIKARHQRTFNTC
ncbi:methyltransferase [Oceanospirillum sediminis]|uniref:Methyltransferase n=1 Tax=Oceanospirillum sediminis TaxID=2760088 RepID=A0A839IV90_9GAMM|nr:methyltransferase [Oceanospirillum sediminis]MBB1488337.1 methyltransferase [Oceanospirillum sediminis]